MCYQPLHGCRFHRMVRRRVVLLAQQNNVGREQRCEALGPVRWQA